MFQAICANFAAQTFYLIQSCFFSAEDAKEEEKPEEKRQESDAEKRKNDGRKTEQRKGERKEEKRVEGGKSKGGAGEKAVVELEEEEVKEDVDAGVGRKENVRSMLRTYKKICQDKRDLLEDIDKTLDLEVAIGSVRSVVRISRQPVCPSLDMSSTWDQSWALAVFS